MTVTATGPTTRALPALLLTLLLTLLLLPLGGCGFQLRGQATLPDAMRLTYLDDRRDPASRDLPLIEALTRALRGAGVRVTPTPEPAGARLTLTRIEYTRRALATGRAGNVREYNLRYDLAFRLDELTGGVGTDGSNGTDDNDDVRPLAAGDLSVSRDLLYNEAQVLGAVAGEQIAREALAEQAAAVLLRRLQAVP